MYHKGGNPLLATRTIEGVPSVVQGTVAEVTNEFSSGDVLHDGKFQETNEGNDLGNTGSRDGVEGGETVGDRGEGRSRVVNVSRKADSGLGNQVADDGKHGDTSVLDLDVSETVELGLVTIGDKSKRIEETKRGLGTEFAFEGSQRRGLGGFLGGGKGGGLA